MAEKAGVKVGDTVEQIFGRKPSDLNDAQQKIQSSNEVSMNLKRFVANPPNMPWTLEDKNNQIVVNHFDKGGRMSGVSDHNTAGYQNSFQSSQALGGAPFAEEIRRTTTTKRTETREGPADQIAKFTSSNNENLPVSNTVKSESHSNWDQDEGNIKKHYETNRTYTRTESSNVTGGGGSGGAAQQQSIGAAPFNHGSNFSSSINANNWQSQQSGGGQEKFFMESKSKFSTKF
uniref:PDZ domain-containing protein n=1 Tax=Panagrolaimus superbus TaxID=310955 RepID=A0A914XUI7_9BILA